MDEEEKPKRFGWVPRAAAAALAVGAAGVMVAAIRANRKGQAARAPAEEAEPGVLRLSNAGMVLFNPFLPRFFERLGVLTTEADGTMRIEGYANASRAVHMLQYLIDERLDTPDAGLALPKLLCGLDAATPVAARIEPQDADRFLCDELTRAVISNWPILHNKSPASLREVFLQRAGKLRHADDHWELRVERKTIDVLVDQVPWNFSTIHHPWMTQPVHVTW